VRTIGGHEICAALALLAAVVGCSRRAVEAPPSVASSSPTSTSPATPPAETIRDDAGSSSDALELAPVFFAYDSYRLGDLERAQLDRHAVALRDRPHVALTIEGHCDERGTNEYNQALGQRRADVVREYLVEAGIARGRVRTISFGEERPFATGADEGAWSQNRRAHFEAR
jgi:peptidoglycan-associated lipoprotein